MARFTTRNISPLILHMNVNGEARKIKFEPAVIYGRVQDTQFSTHDRDVIEFLKHHPMFGSGIFIEEDEPVEQEVPEEVQSQPMEEVVVTTAVEEAQANATEDDSDKYRALCRKDAPIEEYTSVVSVATAKSILQMKHGYTAGKKKAAEIKEDAARQYNVVFPNWR